MSEKKAKQERQRSNQVMFEFNIRAMGDGSIQVAGPFQNFMAFREIMARAELAVISTLAQGEQSRIIKPNPGLQIIN